MREVAILIDLKLKNNCRFTLTRFENDVKMNMKNLNLLPFEIALHGSNKNFFKTPQKGPR